MSMRASCRTRFLAFVERLPGMYADISFEDMQNGLNELY